MTEDNMTTSWWRNALRPALTASTVLIALAVADACVGKRPTKCTMNSDCAAENAVCDGHGFCQKECDSNIDCPCGSQCFTSCGICIRDDLAGPATCFGQNRDLTSAAIMGACGIREAPDSGASPAIDAGAEERACDPQAPLPQCSTDPPQVYPPRDSGVDADDASEAGDADVSDAVEPGDAAGDEVETGADSAPNDDGGNR